jgi:hypothetical protein
MDQGSPKMDPEFCNPERFLHQEGQFGTNRNHLSFTSQRISLTKPTSYWFCCSSRQKVVFRHCVERREPLSRSQPREGCLLHSVNSDRVRQVFTKIGVSHCPTVPILSHDYTPNIDHLESSTPSAADPFRGHTPDRLSVASFVEKERECRSPFWTTARRKET